MIAPGSAGWLAGWLDKCGSHVRLCAVYEREDKCLDLRCGLCKGVGMFDMLIFFFRCGDGL